jgi:hypothetical protein
MSNKSQPAVGKTKSRKFCPACSERVYRQTTNQSGHIVYHRICGSCDWQRVESHNGPASFVPRHKKMLSTVARISHEAAD